MPRKRSKPKPKPPDPAPEAPAVVVEPDGPETELLSDPRNLMEDSALIEQAYVEGWLQRVDPDAARRDGEDARAALERARKTTRLLCTRAGMMGLGRMPNGKEPDPKKDEEPIPNREQLAAARIHLLLTRELESAGAPATPGHGGGPAGGFYQQINIGGSAAAPPRPGSRPWIVTTLAAVAEFFGVSPETVKDWREKGMPGIAGGPGHLGRYDLAEILQWRDANIGGTGRNDARIRNESRAEADRRKAWAAARSAELGLRREEREVVEADTIARYYLRLQGTARGLFEQIPDRLLAALPQTATAADKRRFRDTAEKAIGDICASMQASIEKLAEEEALREKEEKAATDQDGSTRIGEHHET